MNFDLELILLVGTALSGLIWIYDRVKLRPARMAAAGEASVEAQREIADKTEPWYVEYAKSFFPVLLVVLVLRGFIAEPFRIPSGSMIPTLHIGDFILVNKFTYGLRLPVSHTKILDLGEPERGDVVVFRYPRNPELDYIKRVIGVPGDHVEFRDKKILINGVEPSYEEVGPYDDGSNPRMGKPVRFHEDLLGVKHDILINPGRRNVSGEVVVPEGHYFVMGDNRDNSNDGRFWGFVPEENLVGRAMVIWMNWNFDKGNVDFKRIGTIIK